MKGAAHFLGFLVGSGLSTLLTLAPGDGYTTYGWRVLFLLALPIGAIGLYLRRNTEEGAEFQKILDERKKTNVEATPLADAFRLYWKRIALVLFYMGVWAVYATTLTNYLPTFLKQNESLSETAANAANLTSSLFIIVVILAFSPIADRIGLRAAAITATIAVIVITVPGSLIAANGVAGGFIGAALLGAGKGILAVPLLLSVSQIFPAAIRVTAGGLSYNLANAVLGGTAPFVAVWLGNISGSSIAFASYVIFFALISLLIALTALRGWVQESADQSGDVGAVKAAAKRATQPVA